MSYLGRSAPMRANSRSVRVLHVDDQRDLAELSAAFLPKHDDSIDVVVETSAADGSTRIEAERIDCVVSDYDMPGRNGLEFLEDVREAHGDLPFILYTGKGSEEIASEAISAGVTDYLQKGSGTEQYAVLANRIGNAVRQHRSQRAVEKTEEKLTQLTEATDDVLFMFDGDWEELLFVNSAYEDIWGGSIDELREDPASFREYVHPDDQAIADGVLDRVGNGVPAAVEYRILPGSGSSDGSGVSDRGTDPDGTPAEGDVRWIRGETYPILDGDDSVDKIAGYVRDVTERKTRERELEALATAMNAATDGIAILDANREFTFANDAHARIYGFDDPDDLVGRSWRSCYDEGEIPRFEAEILPALAESGHWQGDMTVTGVDGRTIHQDLALTVLADDRVVCVVRDVSDRVERQRELERYEDLVEALTDSVSVVDEDGTIRYKNPAIERILGYEPGALEDEDVFDIVHPQDRAEVRDAFRTLVESDEERTERVQYRARHADGSYRWLESEAGSGIGSVLDGTVVTSRDVTERQAYRERLERQNERLDAFAGIVCHDLRNPLTVARTRLDLAREECANDHLAEIEDHVERVDEALDRMAALIDDVRTIARADETTMSVEAVDVSLLAERYWSTVETADAELVTESAPTVLADGGLVRGLLENLFRNAVVHAGEDVTVTVGGLDDGFFVADDGVGVTDAERESVFDYGYSTRADGTGVGLSIVEGIAEAHDWDVRVTDSDDGGARFEFTGTEFAGG